MHQNENLTASTDSSSNCSEQPAVDYPNTFEGPEKNLEIDFVASMGHPAGLRALSRAQLDALCDAAKCTILSKVSNESLDAYVLSESSLFVYPHKLLMKTCGTTTLLKTLPLVTQYLHELEMSIEKVRYSRKNFLNPEEQHFPHTSFTSEVDFLNDYFPNGAAHVLGPITGDHWYSYVWDAEAHGPVSPVNNNSTEFRKSEHTVHMLMQDMHPDVAAHFFKRDNGMDGEAMSKASGIRDLCPDAILDSFAFEPCGYSMNSIENDVYSTVHITPESHCSYASYETNDKVGAYAPMVEKVLSVFRPAKMTLTMSILGEMTMKDHVFQKCQFKGYKRRGGWTQVHMDGDLISLKANFVIVE
ncbi:Aste57867_8948 [Aphanomyces stellatus]|uniref:S-adenosylmethionine decarboxylase proenzyme n=1 Tax=Aphanomyces stellatus TaxID=120398 RepID=A0A485KLY0_9STRA|nr:hypothetical protein As57867_008913 [Aphanomyces stellatus]VFT85832.1 Aste57867_8948 [Aphanomyces stellatus]